jgi:nucleoside-diphosphate-sugar epimerase
MNVLVTGGTGFLGRRLVERLLAEKRNVTVLGRTPAPDLEARGVRFVTAALNDPVALRFACQRVQTVFHVASKVGVWGRPEEFHQTNVDGTRHVIETCLSQGVKRLVYTSTPSVVYNGEDLAGVNESLPLTTDCPSPYALTKAQAERDVLSANSPRLQTIALRPHLIWGVGDPHLIPRILARAMSGRLRIIGEGRNRVDLVHVENAVDAHLAAEQSLTEKLRPGAKPAAGRAFFITNGEPVVLWDWINELLRAMEIKPVMKRMTLPTALALGGLCETAWRFLPLRGEPPMTRFVANELAKDHWFDITAARRDLGYSPRISMLDGTADLVLQLKNQKAGKV